MQSATALGETSSTTARITISEGAMGSSLGKLGIVLAHEAKHSEQFSGLMGDVRSFRMFLSDKLNNGAYRNEVIEPEAYKYGCESSTISERRKELSGICR